MESLKKQLLTFDFSPTIKIFNHDPYIKACEAIVLGVKGPFVVTDQTIFYAESGGQESDQGTIDGVRVVDVSKHKGFRLFVKDKPFDVPAVTIDTVFVHQLEEDAPFQVGEKVEMKLDWERRYNLMRYHSVGHVLYWVTQKVCNSEENELFLRGCSIREGGARFDFFGDVPIEKMELLKKVTNDFIASEHKIEMLAEPQTTDIHYWKCSDIVMPCGGTHVRSTEELAPIAVKRTKKGKNNTRVGCVFVE